MEPQATDIITEQVLALAGVTQVARLVDQVSKTGEYPAEFLTPVINSLFEFDASSTTEIYGGVINLKLGLQNLTALLANRNGPENQELVRYVFSMLYLERKFAANAQMQDIVRSRLEHAAFKSEHFATHVNEVCHSLSGIYQDTLSNFKFRIRVSGSAQQLENTRNADTLEDDWPYFDETDPINSYNPLYVDAVVSNPPYSQQWDPDHKESDPEPKGSG